MPSPFGATSWIRITGSANEVGSKSSYLRIEEAKIDHPSINYAEEYRFNANLPPLDR